MYNNRFFCIALLTIVFSIGLIFHTAEADGISISSGSDIYYLEDYIVIFGTVDTIFEQLPVTIQVYHEASLVDVAQVPVAADGTFAATFNATGSQWKEEGTYSARAFYTANIIDEITVSAISGNIVTLSAAQKLTDGQELTFSKSGWEFKDVAAKAKDSGTTSVTMSTTQQVAKVGTADVTVELDIDEYISVKPNAFPVNVDCPAGGSVEMRLPDICENYLGTRGDLDANLSSKTFKVHSIPAGATSSAAIRTGDASIVGTLSKAADEAFGSAGVSTINLDTTAGINTGDSISGTNIASGTTSSTYDFEI